MPVLADHIAELENSLRELKADRARIDNAIEKVTAAITALEEIEDGSIKTVRSTNGQRPDARAPAVRKSAEEVMGGIMAVLQPHGQPQPLTVEEVADRVGLSKAYVRRMLYRLRDEGRVRSEPGGWKQPDWWLVTQPTDHNGEVLATP